MQGRAVVKTLDDVKADMSELYEETKAGTVDVKLAGELSNITGKYLKAYALQIAETMLIDRISPRRIGNDG